MLAAFMIVCLLIGLGSAVWAVREALTLVALVLRGARTQGTVVRLIDHDETSTPVIAFVDTSGHQVEFQPRITASGRSYPVGTQVPVLYEPGRSDHARIATVRYVGGTLLFLGVLSLIFTTTGVYVALGKFSE